MQRLEANEEAIEQSQKVAEGERAERKRLTKMLKAKTAELKEKVKEALTPMGIYRYYPITDETTPR